MHRPRRAVLALVAVLLCAGPVAGHVPGYPSDNATPESAGKVTDATKSHSFYDRLDAGGVRYYELAVDAGERLRVETYTPAGGEFVPSLGVFRAGRPTAMCSHRASTGRRNGARQCIEANARSDRPTSRSRRPPTITLPAGASAVSEPTTALVAVHEPDKCSGPIGLVVGHEERF